jgi:hypothetical protein
MRSALAHQVRRPESAFGTSRNCGGFGRETLIRIAAVFGSGAKTIAEPAQRESGGLRHAHDVPAAGNGVAESVKAAFRIERRTIGGGKNHAGSSDGGADDSSARDAHTYSARSLIAGTGDDRCSCAETSCVCSSGGKLAADFLRFEEPRKKFYVDACFVEEFV